MFSFESRNFAETKNPFWHRFPQRPSFKSPPTSSKPYVFEVSTPGFRRRDLAVMVKGEVLIVKGDKGFCPQQKPKEYINKPTGFDCFEMHFHLTPSMAKGSINATYDGGVLRITFLNNPKVKPNQNRVIQII